MIALTDKRQPASVGNSNTTLWSEQVTLSDKNTLSSRSRCLAIVTIFFFFVAVAFIVAFLAVFLHDKESLPESGTDKSQTIEEICATDDCLQTAAFISSSLDTTTEPCEDFYQFACGKWLETHCIAPDETYITPRSLLDTDTIKILKEALTENDSLAPEAVNKARTFFRSCENTNAIDARGSKPLKDFLMSGRDNLFPTLTTGWTEEGLSFTELVERIGSVGGLQSAPVISVTVAVDIKQSQNAIIKFDQQSTLLAASFYTIERNNSVLTMYKDVYTEILTLLGANQTVAAWDAYDVVSFEVELAKILDTPQSRADESAIYNKMTVKNLTDRYPQFDWLGYLRKLFIGTNITIQEDEVVVDMALRYYDKLFPLINATSERTLLNYGMWRIVWTLVGLANKELGDAKGRFMQSLQGTSRSPERWEQCVAVTMTYFPKVVGRLYVELKNFTQHAKQRVEEIADNLLEAFKEMVGESDWMTNHTKQAALNKANNMGYKIGYPDFILNDTWLDLQYKDFTVEENKFFENNVNMFLQNRLHLMQTLRKPVDDTRWAYSAASSSVGYVPTRNEIEFPAGILQFPFFSDQFPDAMNYGAVGSLIGHEITHGYDVSGRLYDQSGNLATWWQPEDVQKFLARAKCMMDQYSKFTDPVLKKNVNGMLTLSENIADNGGVKEAYRAYRRTVDKRGREEAKLPVLPYTPDQLFFIGFAQIWCGKYRDTYRELLLHLDVHSPHRFRVLGTLQNNVDFAKAFNCPTGSPMNPQEKCQVW